MDDARADDGARHVPGPAGVRLGKLDDGGACRGDALVVTEVGDVVGEGGDKVVGADG